MRIRSASNALLIALLCWLPGAALSDSTSQLPTGLPNTLAFAPAVWDGNHVYLFGGAADWGVWGKILRFNPSTGTTSFANARFPDWNYGSSAVWDGQDIHVFGGAGSPLNIFRYDPAQDSLTQRGAEFPYGLVHPAAIWDGQYAYVLGGFKNTVGGYSDEIFRYDPVADQLDLMAARLPSGRERMSAVWDGSQAYLFGGRDAGGFLSQILEYDPASDSIRVMGAGLPTTRMATSAAWDGTHAFIFGGYNGAYFRDVLKYYPASDTVTIMSATMPTPIDHSAAAWTGGSAYVFGGLNSAGYRRDILRYDLHPAAPQNPSAATGPAVGKVFLRWDPPSGNTYSAITAYRIYRCSSDGGSCLLVTETGSETSHTDTGLVPGLTYWYRVRAVNNGRDEGAPSTAVNAQASSVPGNLQVQQNPDGTTTVFDDADGDGDADPEEVLASTPA